MFPVEQSMFAGFVTLFLLLGCWLYYSHWHSPGLFLPSKRISAKTEKHFRFRPHRFLDILERGSLFEEKLLSEGKYRNKERQADLVCQQDGLLLESPPSF
jgi:hypothetical protein